MEKICIAGILLITSLAHAEIINFDKMEVGKIPKDWISGVTGGGSPIWNVVTDNTSPSKPNILKQSGEGTFPWCVLKNVSLADGFVEVKFKPISGKEDQAGGLVWRWKNSDNYYIARANALEDNVAIYHTINGARVAFKSGDIKVTPNQWHTLRVDFHETHFSVIFDGKQVIEADNDSIKGTGAIGVWTKADSITLFDDFTYGGK